MMVSGSVVFISRFSDVRANIHFFFLNKSLSLVRLAYIFLIKYAQALFPADFNGNIAVSVTVTHKYYVQPEQ